MVRGGVGAAGAGPARRPVVAGGGADGARGRPLRSDGALPGGVPGCRGARGPPLGRREDRGRDARPVAGARGGHLALDARRGREPEPPGARAAGGAPPGAGPRRRPPRTRGVRGLELHPVTAVGRRIGPGAVSRRARPGRRLRGRDLLSGAPGAGRRAAAGQLGAHRPRAGRLYRRGGARLRRPQCAPGAAPQRARDPPHPGGGGGTGAGPHSAARRARHAAGPAEGRRRGRDRDPPAGRRVGRRGGRVAGHHRRCRVARPGGRGARPGRVLQAGAGERDAHAARATALLDPARPRRGAPVRAGREPADRVAHRTRPARRSAARRRRARGPPPPHGGGAGLGPGGRHAGPRRLPRRARGAAARRHGGVQRRHGGAGGEVFRERAGEPGPCRCFGRSGDPVPRALQPRPRRLARVGGRQQQPRRAPGGRGACVPGGPVAPSPPAGGEVEPGARGAPPRRRWGEQERPAGGGRRGGRRTAERGGGGGGRARARTAEPVSLELPPLAGFLVLSTHEVIDVSVGGPGAPVRTTVRELQLRATKVGTLLIGAVHARQGRVIVATDPIVVTVDSGAAGGPPALTPLARDLVDAAPPPERTDRVALTVVVPTDTVLAGQQLDVVATAWFPRELRNRLHRPPQVTIETPQRVWANPAARSSDVAASRLVRGSWLDLYVAHQVGFPLAAGRVVIPPASVEFAVPTTFSFFSREERYALQSDSVTIVVLPLPVEGRPADDQRVTGRGLVLALDVQPADARVGEPLEVTTTVAGVGNVALWPEPSLRWPPGFRPYPAEPDARIDWQGGRISGSKVFRYLVVPDSAGTFVLPELRYPYYDLGQGGYAVASAAPRTLVVAPGTEPRAARALPPLAPVGGEAWASAVARDLFPWSWGALLCAPPLIALAWRRLSRPRGEVEPAPSVAPQVTRLGRLEREFHVVLARQRA